MITHFWLLESGSHGRSMQLYTSSVGASDKRHRKYTSLERLQVTRDKARKCLRRRVYAVVPEDL